MKVNREKLSEEEFEEYCQDICSNMESATTFYGQIDETVPYYGELKRRHIYGEENDEHESVLYVQNYDEETGNITYDIYDTID